LFALKRRVSRCVNLEAGAAVAGVRLAQAMGNVLRRARGGKVLAARPEKYSCENPQDSGTGGHRRGSRTGSGGNRRSGSGAGKGRLQKASGKLLAVSALKNAGSARKRQRGMTFDRRPNASYVRESPLDTMTSSRVNQYRMVKKKPIGEGWQSKVYLVEDTGGARPKRYALKELKLKRMDKVINRATDSNLADADDGEGGSAWVEVSVGKMLRHRNIVPLVEVIQDAETMCLVMELQEGGVLVDREKQKRSGSGSKRFALSEARRCIREVLEGLQYMHGNGIVHRDIKVDNVLVAQDGTCKIADFGMAHIIEEGKDDTLSQAIGARKYRAPELFVKPCRPYSGFKADVWATGCVLYCLVNGELPFGGKSKRDLVYNIQNRPLTVTKRMEREPQLCKLIKGMLTKDWEKRISVDDALRNRWLAS